MNNFFFSTGKLYVALASQVGLTDADVVGAIQSADFDPKFEVKEMREASVVTLWAVASKTYDASATLKISAGDLSEIILQFTTGAIKSTSGSNNVYTATTTSTPPYVQIKLVGELVDGRAATLEIGRCRAAGMTLGAKRDDYAMPDVEFTVYPADPSSTPWKLTIAQS